MLCPRVDWGEPKGRCPLTLQGTSSLDPFRDSVGDTFKLLLRVYPQLTHTVPRIHKLRNRPVTGVCTAKVSKGRSQSPLVAPAGAKSPATRKNKSHRKNTRQKSALRKEVTGKNRKFPYRPFYHENPHLKSPKIPPIPCHPRHGASKQGCKSAAKVRLFLFVRTARDRRQKSAIFG